jgi:CheY-like chemotaxis protein
MKKVLIVDDEKDQITVIKKALEGEFNNKYLVIPAESGKKCLKILKENEYPDIILLDIMMPEMDGWEVLDILKSDSQWSKIPVIILTARSDALASRAGGLIADDFISKPIKIQELNTRIMRVINKKNKVERS